MANHPFPVEEANYVSNQGYMFRSNNNLPSHYHPGLKNHENFLYGNQAIVPHEPHQLRTTMAPLIFQNQGALSSNFQGNTRQSGFHELLLTINDMKKSNDTIVIQLENGQDNMSIVMKSLENIQVTMGIYVRNLETS